MKYNFKEIREKAGLSIADVAELTGYTERTVYRWENNEAKPRKGIAELLTRIANTTAERNVKTKVDFTFIDLFAGIGGFRKGFESINGKCVFTSEWNRFSRQTYLANYGCDHSITGDISKVEEADIPKHDVLLAGFPCQPFSLAGVSKKKSLGKEHGFRDKTQGTLFFDVARILDYHRPSAFVLENVKNLVSHNKGDTFQKIMETLKELEYEVINHRIIDAKGFVPQHRERIFIVGFKKDTGFNFNDLVIPDRNSGPRLHTILHPQDGSEEEEYPFTEGKEAKINDKYTLTPRLWEYLQEYAAKHKARGNGFGFGLFDGDGVARTLSARYHKDGSEILIKQNRKRPRRLTPRECSRIMGFDLPGQSQFEIPVSDTQAYRQFGNAVVVPVVEAIAKHMQPHIKKAVKANKTKKTSSNKSAKAKIEAHKQAAHG